MKFMDYSIYTNYLNINEGIQKYFDQKLFDQESEGYDSIYSSILPSNTSAKILDVGCGNGMFLYYLKKKGYINSFGIDLNIESIQFTKQYITEKVECVNIERFLKDKKEVYDVIVMNEVLEHIPVYELINVVSNIRIALKLGGLFICYVPNMENPITGIFTRYHDLTHTIGFTSNSLTMSMRLAGFNCVKIIPIGHNKENIKNNIRKFFQKLIHKFLVLAFDYPQNGMMFSLRILSVAKKQ